MGDGSYEVGMTGRSSGTLWRAWLDLYTTIMTMYKDVNVSCSENVRNFM